MTIKKIILPLIILIYLCNGIYSINHWSITADEGSHLRFGINILKANPIRPKADEDNSKMPITALNALPRAFEQVFTKNLVKNDWGKSDIEHGRYVTLLFSVLTILLVYYWAKMLNGVYAGLFAVFLMSVCPNNLANAVLLTTDAYSSFFLLVTMFSVWLYCKQSSTKHFILLSIVVALSQLAKQTFFHFYFLIPTMLLIYWLINKKAFNVKTFFKNLLLFVFINWLIINIGYTFYKPFTSLSDYTFLSNAFISIQKILPKWFPVPVSYSFLQGLDMAKYYDQIGGGRVGVIESALGNVNILGKSSTGGSFWYYYFVSIFFKTPIAFFIFFVWKTISNYKQKKLNATINFILLFPIAYFVAYFSFLYNAQGGIRHLIFIYPLLFVYISGLVNYLNTLVKKVIASSLCIYLCFSVAWFYKNYFSYTNEFIINQTNAYNIVGTSNINITQANYYLSHFLEKNRDIQYATTTPQKGTFIILVDDYVDVWNKHQYDWLKAYKPCDNVADGCYLLIKVE